MNVSRVAVLIFAVAVMASHADETNLTLTVDGVIYSNVTFGTVTPLSVSIRHKTGAASVPLWKLPPDLQQRFRYDPVRAADYMAAQQRAEAARQEALRQRSAEEAAERQRQAKEQAEKQNQAAEAAATAKKAADAQAVQYGPVMRLTFTYAYNIKQLRDGTYSANLFYSDDVGDLRSLYVTFPAAGLNYLRSVRNSNLPPNSCFVYGRPYAADLVNAFGGPAGDNAYWLVGTHTGTDAYTLW